MDFQADDRLEPGVSGDGLLGGASHELEIIKGRGWRGALAAKAITTEAIRRLSLAENPHGFHLFWWAVRPIGTQGRPRYTRGGYGFWGASRYFSIGISKNRSSLPRASVTPEISMVAPRSGELRSTTSKKKNPDCVVWGSTARAAN